VLEDDTQHSFIRKDKQDLPDLDPTYPKIVKLE
jgi:hypothetical protein